MVPKRSSGFVVRDSGAATFDWVILAVGVFGLALALYSVIDAGRGDAPPPTQTVIAAPANPGEALPDDVEALRSMPLLYPYFRADWRSAMITQYAALSDAALLAQYAAQYDLATGPVNAEIGADMLGLIEAEMRLRGLPLPDENRSAADIHAGLATPEG